MAGERTVTASVDGFEVGASVELEPDAVETVDVELETADLPIGDHHLLVDTGDDDVRTTLRIVDPAAPAWDLDVDAPASIDPAETIEIDATVTNVGDAPGTVSVELETDDETSVEEVTLEPGESTTVAFDLGDELPAGELEWTVTAGDDSVSGTVSVGEAHEVEVSDEGADDVPGFGPAVAVIALALVTVAAIRRVR